DRLKTLHAISERSHSLIVLATLDSWVQPTLPQAQFLSHQVTFKINEDSPAREELKTTLRKLGYLQTETVQEPGQFAFRGELLDLYSPSSPLPYRIEFFDTVVENIRHFHPETQRTWKTDEEIRHITICPAEEVLLSHLNQSEVLERIKTYADHHQISRKIRDPIFENVRNGFLPDHFRTWFPFVYSEIYHLLDYLPEDAKLFLFEPEQLALSLDLLIKNLKKEEEKYPSPYWITPRFDLLYPDLPAFLKKSFARADFNLLASPEDPLAKGAIPYDRVKDNRVTEADLFEWLEDGFVIWVGTRGISHQDRIKFLLKKIKPGIAFKFLNCDGGESLEFPLHKQIIVSEDKLLGTSALSPKKPKKTPTHSAYAQTDELQFQTLNDLSLGDFVVHSIHGVGKYLGLQDIKAGERQMGEYLLIEYSGGDKLYLPVYRLNTIQRYVSAGGNPSLDKLGTFQFEKAKQKARESARKLAVNLIEIYAKRALLTGPRFETQGQDYFEFCDQFEFTETEGQLKAIQDVLSDLEAGKLLDRLVCGDVGFGKTEVAMRAAFQAVNSGYQVALLVPTTLLAFQHEQSFKKRMASFPIRIESISRFKTKKQQNEILKLSESGQIDILIGTHRLLSKDLKWNKLGLLIVDEEHRFGVDHKEKMKVIQTNTHTLTMTATPIPRTLNMALAGLKEISVIKTPPANRQPIKTYVSSHSDELIKSAIENEINRGGQVFYLFNRVQTIQHQADEIQRLVPHAKVIVAHGQMTEDEIEARMLEFYQGQAQVLVCTTIIESGIDVPNAGTILIHRADQLGLAQLYQIRGRVGRSHRKAYAYLLVDDEGTLTREAKMRLDVLQRFVELGSGFQIASYDLEIRGGGNFLGAEQSGHIASVGLDLFTELLEEAIQELKGQKIDIEERHYEPEIQVPVVCEITPSLVTDSKLRLSLYRKLSNARTDTQVDELAEEFKDRFGDLTVETENLFHLIRIKNLLKRVGIEQLSVNALRTSMTVRKATHIDPDEAMKLYMGPKGLRDPRVQITPDSKIVFQLPFVSLQSHLFELENFLKKIAPKAFENAPLH
ncbi:MAG: transcription-repair coupling factor, partial [Bdellovibrionales bacterium]|nr:transcription-repair coupling factor [Oligoflexia bacterium]